MSEINQFIIDGEGRIYREYISRTEIDPGKTLEDVFANASSYRIKNVTFIPGFGPASVSAKSKTTEQFWSVPVQEIVFRTTFEPVSTKEGSEIFPTFLNDTAGRIQATWNRQEAADGDNYPDIRFMAHIQMATPAPLTYKCGKVYMYAFDKKGNAWKLPMSNLYETCELCNGTYNSEAPTAMDAFIKALEQFRNSSWNQDLYTPNWAAKTRKIFRLKPMEKGFQTLPFDGDWTKSCDKIATPLVKEVVL